MTQAQRYKYPLQLPQSLKETAARLAMEDGVSLNQWIVSAVAQKIGAVETASDFLKARAGKAKRGDLEGRSGSGRILEKQIDQGLAGQRVKAAAGTAVVLDVAVRPVQQIADFISRESLDSQ